MYEKRHFQIVSLAMKEDEWKPFRNALDKKSDRKKF
jgi:hypothetical protein